MFVFGGPEYDVLIVGSGPAGMTAAVYACRSGKSVMVVEKEKIGGQITSSPKVENFPGYTEISGSDFANNLLNQAMANGAEFTMGNVVDIEDGKKYKTVYTEEGDSYTAGAVILANGVKHRHLGLPGENELIGHGIHFCAVCDANLFAGKNVVVVGGGNSALQEAIMLSDIAANVTIVQNLAFLTGEPQAKEALEDKENVSVIYSHVVDAYLTDNGHLTGLRIKSEETGETTEISCEGCFLAIGLVPENDAFSKVAELDEYGYYAAGEICEGSIDGIFVAGDCRRKTVRQLTTAVADGAVAALAACRWLDQK